MTATPNTVPASAADDSPRLPSRWSATLAEPFARWAGAVPGIQAVVVGCGPGVLASFLVDLLGEGHVAALDPSPESVAACRRRLPGIDVRRAPLDAIPFDRRFDLATAHLAWDALPHPAPALVEMVRVVQPGGKVAVTVWDAEGPGVLNHLADACASALGDTAPPGPPALDLGRPGELTHLFEDAGLTGVREIVLTTTVTHRDFDELWSSLEQGLGLLADLPPVARAPVREELFERVGSPQGPFALELSARCCRGVVAR